MQNNTENEAAAKDVSAGKRFPKKLARILVPILIVVIIGSIWILKKSDSQENPFATNNHDFDLIAQEGFDIVNMVDYGLPMIIDFGSDFCAPCIEMKPILQELNKKYRGKVIIKYVDVYEFEKFTKYYPVTILPTQVFIDADGTAFAPEELDAYDMKAYVKQATGELVFTTHEGFLSKEEMEKIIEEMLEN